MASEPIDLTIEPLEETGDVDGRYVSESDYWANFNDEAVHVTPEEFVAIASDPAGNGRTGMMWLGRTRSRASNADGWYAYSQKSQLKNTSALTITVFDDGTWSYGVHG